MTLPNPKKDLNWIMEELIKGQELANRLTDLINGSEEARDWMGGIRSTFSRVITALETSEALNQAGSIESVDVKCEISNGKRKGFDGSDKRSSSRKRIRQTSTRTVMAKTIEDGQAWRKYGQKDIQNSKYPRSYFRCTHKFDQGCEAQKQAQKSEEDPTMYTITYMGNHTCKDSSPLPQIIQSSSLNNSSCLISFESNATISNNYNNKPGLDALVSTSVQSLKQEGEEEVLSNLTMDDRTAGGDLAGMAGVSEQGADRGDVTSSPNCLIEEFDMDQFRSQFEFEEFASFCDLFQLD